MMYEYSYSLWCLDKQGLFLGEMLKISHVNSYNRGGASEARWSHTDR